MGALRRPDRRPRTTRIYYRWYFRTGDRGDFEYLVSLLKPQPVDPAVGTRDMDVQDPGSNLPGIDDPALVGILRLGGALRVPDADLGAARTRRRATNTRTGTSPIPTLSKPRWPSSSTWPTTMPHRLPLAANAATGHRRRRSDDPDPLITSPLYGRWHALTQRLLLNSDGTPAPNNTNWVHRLNLDPRFRVPANFGADMVETNAEEYMNYAWEQIGDVLAANRKFAGCCSRRQVSWRWHARRCSRLRPRTGEGLYADGARWRRRVMASPTTRRVYRRRTSLVPPVLYLDSLAPRSAPRCAVDAHPAVYGVDHATESI